jgi:3-oxoacyl-[acyl-carrier protein] reductase
MNLLSGKTALVTGASRGIGRAVTELFIEEGAAQVICVATKPGPFEAEIKALAESKGSKALFLYGNQGDSKEAQCLSETALKEAGKIDIIVANAGITRDGLFMRMGEEDWKAVMDVNLTGSFFITQRILRDMVAKRSGSVIFLSSVVGVHGNAGQANYAASKAGIIGLAKSLAQEVGSRGIRVNAVAPGYVATDMTEAIPEKAKEAFVQKIPLGRPASAKEVAQACLFLASDLSSYITGTVLSVDGGMGA